MNNYIYYLEQKGLAGMEEIFDSGWGYCLPNAPYRLYEVLKRTQGNTNTESWNGYKRIRLQSRLDDAAIATSIQFLLLLGFITYKSGASSHSVNFYSVTDFVHILALQEEKHLTYLLKVIKSVRKPSNSAKQATKFNKNIEVMEDIIDRFNKQKIETIPTELRIKQLSNGEVRTVRGIGGDAEFFARYEDTLKEIQNFLEALYSSLRNGVNIPVEECKNYCRKCKCVKEITSNDSLMTFILTSKTCEVQEPTCDVQVPTSEVQEPTSTVHDNNKTNNKPYNKIHNLDDEEILGSNSENPFLENQNPSSQTKTTLVEALEKELAFYYKPDELPSLKTLTKTAATNLSVLEIEEVLKIIAMFKKEGYPVSSPDNYFPKLFSNPSLSKARGAVQVWQNSKVREGNKKQSEARNGNSNEYYDELFKKNSINNAPIDLPY